jgi:lipopolysaccharide transport protein LptA
MNAWQFVLPLFFVFGLNAQETFDLSSTSSKDDTSNYKEVEILHADKLAFNTLADGSQIRKLVGSVSLKHDSTLMFCDSAYIYKANNTVKAWGHVHITQKDSIHAYSNTMNYDGKTKNAELIGNARLEDGNKTLYSDVLYYNMEKDLGSYRNGGRVVMDSTILSSTKGYYFTTLKVVHFRENVIITDPEYHLESDTLHYHTDSKVAEFHGPTTIFNDSSTIDCFTGSYDTENEIATFGKGTVIHNAPQYLLADSLYYERFRGYGQAFYYFDWNDTAMDARMEGTLAEYFENSQEIIAYERPMLKVAQDGDTLFLKGDTIRSMENPMHGEKEFWGHPNVRIFKSDLQGVCDSLFYSFNDSLMRLYYNPILWNENSQMTGDTVYIQQANEEVQYIEFFPKAFVSTQSKGKLYDQIKGNKITGYFTDNEMTSMLAEKNAESIYFGKNDDDEYIGCNYAQSDNIKVKIINQEVDRITFLKNPEAVFTPMSQLAESDMYLKGFNWQSTLRPKDKGDL